MSDVKKMRRSRRRAGTVSRTEGRRVGSRLGGGSKGNFADLFNAGAGTGSAPASPLGGATRGSSPATASPAAAGSAPPPAASGSESRRSMKKKRMKKSATLGALQRKQMASQFKRVTLEEGDQRKPDFKLPSQYKNFNKGAAFRPPEAIRSGTDHKAHRIYDEVDKPTSCVDTDGDVGDGWVYPFQYEKEGRKSNALKPLKVVHQAVHKEKTANDIGPGWAPVTTKDHARSASFKPPQMVGKRDAKWDAKKIKHVSRDEGDAGPGWQGTGHKDWASSPKPQRTRQKKTKQDVELAKAGVVRKLAPYKPSATPTSPVGSSASEKKPGKKKKKRSSSSRDMRASAGGGGDKGEKDVGGGWADWNTRNHAKSAPFRPREAVGKRREEREVPTISIVSEKRKKEDKDKKKKKKAGGSVRKKKRAHTVESPRRSPRRSGSPATGLDVRGKKGSRRTLSAYPDSIAAWTAQLDIHPGEEDESIKEERRQWEAEQKRLSGGGDDEGEEESKEGAKEEESKVEATEEESKEEATEEEAKDGAGGEDDVGFEEVGGEVEEHADEEAEAEDDDDADFEEVGGDVEELSDHASDGAKEADADGFEEVGGDDEGFEEVPDDDDDDAAAEELDDEEFEEVDGDVEELDDDDEGFEAVEGSEEEF